MASTVSAIADSASLPVVAGAASAPASSPTMASLSSVTLSTTSSAALGVSGDSRSLSNSAPGVPLSHAIPSVTIKSLVLYTLDLQAHNYTKWRTLFSMVLVRFSLLHHVEDDATYPIDLEWTKENLLVGK
jgi:hypothetical protein